jgi:hypothetical protein
MNQAAKNIEEYVASERRKHTLWISFNSEYNDSHTFKKQLNIDPKLNQLSIDATDKLSKAEFENFMQTNYPETKIVPVFDVMSELFYLRPFLGSYAIDTDIGSDVYNALIKKYEDEYCEAISNKAVLWIMEYDRALRLCQNKFLLPLKKNQT